ncbi:hypothetical protein [Streptomyces sp. AF1A]
MTAVHDLPRDPELPGRLLAVERTRGARWPGARTSWRVRRRGS